MSDAMRLHVEAVEKRVEQLRHDRKEALTRGDRSKAHRIRKLLLNAENISWQLKGQVK